MEEIWKNIVGYENRYQISNLGKVKSFLGVNDRILKDRDHNGYRKITLRGEDSKLKTFRVHRLVAEAFIPNELNNPVVNHIDKNRANNSVNNLEWCDNLYNTKHKVDALIKDRELFNSLCDDCKKILSQLGVN